MIEFIHGQIDFMFSDGGQITVFRKVLSDEAIGILVQSTFPEGIRMREKDTGIKVTGHTFMIGKFSTIVVGVVPSFSRPSVSNDNPYSESLFGTMEYTLAFPSKPFESLDAAREWAYEFAHWYNEAHRHSEIQFVTPAQRHSGVERPILAKRDAVYQAAKQRNPERWSRGTQNWEPVGDVWLNPENDVSEETEIKDEAA